METIGFIGTGVMGKPMALNLLKAGHRVVAHRIKDELTAAGAEAGATPGEVARRADTVILMLPNSPEVRAVMFGPQGLANSARPGQIVIDMSSISPIATREFGGELERRGVAFLDAPVSGGQEKAEKGTLAIMAGGDPAVFDRISPILGLLGKPMLVGPLGAGQTAKLVNQVIVAVNIAAIAEGASLARKAGVDPEKVIDAIRGGLAGSQCLEDKAPRMLAGRYDPGFRVGLHIKDLANALEAAQSLHLSMPLAGQLMQMLQSLAADGGERLDHAALALFYEKINNLSLRGDGAEPR